MALIAACVSRRRAAATFLWDKVKGNAMQHQNSVFHDLLKHVPWAGFERLVEEYGADFSECGGACRRRASSSRCCMASCPSAPGLRAGIVGGAVQSHSARLYHLGAGSVARSTLSDANAVRPYEVFTGLLGLLIGQAHREAPARARQQPPHIRIDTTSLRLSALSELGPLLRRRVRSKKAHVIYDPDADCPVYLAVTPANVNDITAAQAMPIEAGATYVFDLGYYDYH